MVRLQVLGPVALTATGGRELRLLLHQPKRLALLAYLALSSRRGFVRRDTLMALFWPELDQARARNALRQALHFLRKSLDEGAIITRGEDDLRIDSHRLWCDAVAFEDAVEAGRVEEALGLYRQDLLTAFYVPHADEFERWLEVERARLKRLALNAAWRLADALDDAGDDAAVAWAEWAVALAGVDEDAAQKLIRLRLRRGDRTGAMRDFDAFRRRLAAEYGLEPSAQTTALVSHLADTTAASTQAIAPAPTSAIADGSGGVIPTSRSRSWRPWVLATSVAVTALLLPLVRGAGTLPKLDPDLIAVGRFEVLDPRFELWAEGLTSLLSANLDGAGALRTLSAATSLRGWSGDYDRHAAADFGRRLGAGLVVTGHVLGAGGDSMRVHAILVDAGRAVTVAETEVRGDEASFGELVDSLTLAMLRGLGRTRPLGTVRATTIAARPLPALKAFLKGEHYFRRSAWDSAQMFYMQAVELDSTFAPALRRIANVRNWQGVAGGAAARAYHLRAGRFNNGLSLRDSLLVQADSLAAALYAFDADEDWWARRRRLNVMLTEMTRRYPEDPEPWYLLGEAGFHFNTLAGGSLRQILAALERAIALDSAFSPPYLHAINVAAALGDGVRARLYARAYLACAPADVTARGIARFEAAITRGLTADDSLAAVHAPTAAEVLETWAPLSTYPDSAESAVRVARWLMLRDAAAPPPFDDPAFMRRLFVRSLAFRGHLDRAVAAAGASDSELLAERAWLVGSLSDEETRRFDAASRGERALAALALPWWSRRGDNAAIARFIATSRAAAASADGRERERALYDVAAGLAYQAAARGDSVRALQLALSIPDSLCPACYLPKILRAELLLHADSIDRARRLLEGELTAIVGGPRPSDVLWRLLRGEAEERAGNKQQAAEAFRFVRSAWRAADPGLNPLVVRASRGLRRVQPTNPRY